MGRPQPRVVSGHMLGRYVLFDEIASGGMASVHFGRLVGDAGFARTVAIKRLHPQYAKSPEFVRAFLDEARLAARIRHPNVALILDVVALDKELFLVMELIAGESLAQLWKRARARGEPIPLRIAVAIASSMLHGLEAAHQATSEDGEPLHLVHRDVSPQNVMVGSDGVVRVLDFGIAKAQDRVADSTGEGQIKGKIAYMSPEQLRAKAVDQRTDVFAASVVTWEILTGERLFDGDAPVTILQQAIEKPILAPSTVRSGRPASLDAIVLKGLARDAESRWQSAVEMAVALEDACPIAGPREIAEWVKALASDSLAERSEIIRAIEQTDVSAIVTGSGRASPSLPSRRATKEAPTSPTGTALSTSSARAIPAPFPLLRAVAAALLLAVVGAAAFFAYRASYPPRADAAPAPLPVAVEPPVPVIPLPDPSPVTTATAPADAAPVASHASKPASARPRPAPATTGRNPCDPPFIITKEGVTRFKPECVER